jgi:hypothetical protein
VAQSLECLLGLVGRGRRARVQRVLLRFLGIFDEVVGLGVQFEFFGCLVPDALEVAGELVEEPVVLARARKGRGYEKRAKR